MQIKNIGIAVMGARKTGVTHTAEYLQALLEQQGFDVLRNGDSLAVSGTLPPTTVSNQETEAAKPKTALAEAHNVIYGDREQNYGDPGKNLRTIANYWTNHLNAKYGQINPLTPDDVCVMMVLLKQARLATSPKHRDSIVDTIGYAALADRINIAEQATDKAAIG
jgi:hypothetical protein